MNRKEIAAGVYVTTQPGEKFKRCKMMIRLVLPGERATATALAILPSLLDRRCEEIPDAMALSRYLFSLYGAEILSESYTLGENRVVTLGVQGLKNAYALEGENLEEAYVRLCCALLFRPKLANGVFEEEDVAIEKEKQADFLKSEMNDKRLYCLQQAKRKLYGDSPLALESGGYLEDIEGITPAGLFAAYRDLLCRAQVEVSLFGMREDFALEEIRRCLAQVKRAPVLAGQNAAAAPAASLAHFEEPMDALQGKLCIMCTTGEVLDARGSAIMRVASAIYGGLPTSRLFMNVREKQSLCYYCAVSYQNFGGTLTIDSGVEHVDLERAATAILHELAVLQQELISQEELQQAVLALQSAYRNAQDSLSPLEMWPFTERMKGTNLTMEEYAALIGTVTREEVREALATFTPAVQYAITQKEGR